jgi:hypothetical protein
MGGKTFSGKTSGSPAPSRPASRGADQQLTMAVFSQQSPEEIAALIHSQASEKIDAQKVAGVLNYYQRLLQETRLDHQGLEIRDLENFTDDVDQLLVEQIEDEKFPQSAANIAAIVSSLDPDFAADQFLQDALRAEERFDYHDPSGALNPWDVDRCVEQYLKDNDLGPEHLPAVKEQIVEAILEDPQGNDFIALDIDELEYDLFDQRRAALGELLENHRAPVWVSNAVHDDLRLGYDPLYLAASVSNYHFQEDGDQQDALANKQQLPESGKLFFDHQAKTFCLAAG